MPTKILLSIKPEFAAKIFAEEIEKIFAQKFFDEKKDYEFRRVIFAQKGVKTVVVYASHPACKVIGEFEIEDILHKKIGQLWQETRHAAGIAKAYFDEYFAGKTLGYAIKIKSRKLYRPEKCLTKDFGIQYPPQSFVYIND
ncbi:MAG: hypothetical protein MPK31_02465 [Gammaproteobacteria bacterium]|nr:hypothetical protein [Gammaproteobacteria bacterium]MDA8014767.1 hypothetical protein [Gammaproteobacteria bacterium]